jgi:small subunit ribosomal protein S17
MIGIVVSVKMDKTAVVSIERRERHPLYRKIVRSTKKYKAHDPRNEAVLGDVVRIEETRPISKEKRWRIAETLVRGNVADVAPREIGVPEEAIASAQPVTTPVVEPAEAPVATPVAETPVEVEAAVAEETSEPEASIEEAPDATELAADEAEASAAEQPEAAAGEQPDEEKGT